MPATRPTDEATSTASVSAIPPNSTSDVNAPRARIRKCSTKNPNMLAYSNIKPSILRRPVSIPATISITTATSRSSRFHGVDAPTAKAKSIAAAAAACQAAMSGLRKSPLCSASTPYSV